MFAPRLTARFTRFWFTPMPSSGVSVWGGCAFWLVVIYVFVALWLIQASVWLVVVTLIWTAQLIWLPVKLARRVE